jgi:hypothetical protein
MNDFYSKRGEMILSLKYRRKNYRTQKPEIFMKSGFLMLADCELPNFEALVNRFAEISGVKALLERTPELLI